MLKHFGIYLIAACLLPLATGAADELIVKDMSGYVRAVSEVPNVGNIEFSVVDATGVPADGVEVTLINSSTNERLNALAANGLVLFENVSPGAWTVATGAPGITFTNVAITSAAPVAAGFAGPVAAVPIIAGVGGIGAAIGIAAATDDDDDKRDEMSPAS